jgi:hypothetical protein
MKKIMQTLERRFDVSFETTTALPDGSTNARRASGKCDRQSTFSFPDL